jgi:hypothetical protein
LRIFVVPNNAFHFVTAGTSDQMIRILWSRIAERGRYKISHIVHPMYSRSAWVDTPKSGDIHFFRDRYGDSLPKPDLQLLASLETAGGPTVNNMLLSDRFVSRLTYEDGLRYATYLARRLFALYEETKPSVVIGDFDALHGSLEMVVARQMGIPWVAPAFTVIPSGMAAFCNDLSPAAAVELEPGRHAAMVELAESCLSEFEGRRLKAPAYIPPPLFSPSVIVRSIPSQAKAFLGAIRRRSHRESLKYTDSENSYSVNAKVREAFRLRRNLWRLHRRPLVTKPIDGPYAFFGLHMQPESSIDVIAHFFANQPRVIELIARSLPPTHRLLVKLHKSDAPNYSPEWLARIEQLPGVQVVSPYADTFELIRLADLVVSIQGTIGLEAALLGKPVVLFGDSPVRCFPSASTVGRAVDLPKLIREKLAEGRPDRARIVDAYARYLAPYYPASMNNWQIRPTDAEIDGYVKLFGLLENYVKGVPSTHGSARG